MPRDYYEVLGVRRDADETEIKKSFRRLARELHPDVNRHDPNAEEKFKEAAEAYEVLSDAQRRATYDRHGHEGLNRGGYAPNFEGFGSVADIFDAFFGGAFGATGGAFGAGARQAGPAQGADVSVAAVIDLAGAATGTKVDVGYEVITFCEHCRGNGAEPGTPIETCQRCNGTGQLRVVSRTPFGQVVRTTACDVCLGDGRTARRPCGTCDGRGRRVEHVKLSVDVPAGIASGQRIRVTGRGHAGDRGGPAGDLYVLLTVSDDPRFVRDGDDLLTTVDVSAPLAALGTVVQVPTVDGEIDLEIPAGTQPHEIVVVRGRGMPSLRGRRPGDLRVVVNVVIPRHLTRDQRELMTQLSQALTEENLHSEDGVLHKLRRAFGGDHAARHRR